MIKISALASYKDNYISIKTSILFNYRINQILGYNTLKAKLIKEFQKLSFLEYSIIFY